MREVKLAAERFVPPSKELVQQIGPTRGYVSMMQGRGAISDNKGLF